MKLAVVYDPKCPKLTPSAYSQTYRDQFTAVLQKFKEIQIINLDCSAKAFDADVILIYDIHSSHNINIGGLADHRAVKYTYFDDPHQVDFKGRYIGGPPVWKLGANLRTAKALERGVDFIICPYKNAYFKHIGPHLGTEAEKMLFWFPPAPSIKRFRNRTLPLFRRNQKVLGNGFINASDISIYDFRRWAFTQDETFYVKHATERPDVPQGYAYEDLLTQFAGAFALCDWHVVPKYQEIPLAGCVCFAQIQGDYTDMGFKDSENCLYVTKDNFKERLQEFLNAKDLSRYQAIADAGRTLIETKWTAECFADALYNHAQEHINQPNPKGTKP